MKTFIIAGHEYSAENCIDGVLIDPLLPDDFDSAPMDARKEDNMDKWYKLPFIQSQDNGIYTVRRLDDGAWDRSTLRGGFDSLNKAIDFVLDTYGFNHWSGV